MPRSTRGNLADGDYLVVCTGEPHKHQTSTKSGASRPDEALTYPAYAVYGTNADETVLRPALEGLRAVAAEEKP